MFRNLLIGSVTLAMVAVLAGASLADNQPKRKAPVPKTSQPAPKKASVRIETPKPAPPKVVTVPIVRVPIKPPTQNPGRPPLQLPPTLTSNGQPPANQPQGQGVGSISSPTEIFVITAPTAMVAGNSIAVNVKAFLRNGKFTSFDNSYNGPVTLTSSDGQLTPVTIQLSQGTGTANIVLTKVGTITLSATAGSVSGQSPITVNPSPIVKTLKILGLPGTGIHANGNAWLQVELLALDPYGNVASAGGYATIQSSAPVKVSANPVQMQNGKGNFFCQFAQAETVTVSVSFIGIVASQTVNVAK